ncbi:MAG: hypothetical protein LBJ10_09415, partial [Clostridiales bacterium]|nr:hypothetical protein [Clostridiales bacterium]
GFGGGFGDVFGDDGLSLVAPIVGAKDVTLNYLRREGDTAGTAAASWTYGAPIESLAEAAGGELQAVYGYDQESGAAAALKIVAAIYRDGRLIDVSEAAFAGGKATVGVDVPADTAGCQYRLFVWQAGSYAPVRAAYVLD